ncbi:hypothetical protein Pelo_1593 [Pelomyxa schiedti]|nr:hypothetical protein Pelo_1593 [Pelomyxa schiedti]
MGDESVVIGVPDDFNITEDDFISESDLHIVEVQDRVNELLELNEAMRLRVAHLEDRNKELEQRHEVTRAKLAVAESQLASKNRVESVCGLTASRGAALLVMDSTREERLRKMEQELRTAQEELLNAKESLAQLNSANEELRLHRDFLLKSEENLQLELKKRGEDSAQTKTDLEAQISKLQQENSKLSSRNDKLNKLLASSPGAADNKKEKKAIDKLLLQIEGLQEELETAQTKYAKSQKKLTKLSSKVRELSQISSDHADCQLIIKTLKEQLSEPTTLTTENEKFYGNAISRNCVLQEQISALQGKLERITSENHQLIQNLAKASAEAEVGKQWMTVASSLQISSPEILQTSLKLQEKRLSAATEKCTDLNKKLKKANNKLKNSQERARAAEQRALDSQIQATSGNNSAKIYAQEIENLKALLETYQHDSPKVSACSKCQLQEKAIGDKDALIDALRNQINQLNIQKALMNSQKSLETPSADIVPPTSPPPEIISPLSPLADAVPPTSPPVEVSSPAPSEITTSEKTCTLPTATTTTTNIRSTTPDKSAVPTSNESIFPPTDNLTTPAQPPPTKTTPSIPFSWNLFTPNIWSIPPTPTPAEPPPPATITTTAAAAAPLTDSTPTPTAASCQ